jgi:hypothetical protein
MLLFALFLAIAMGGMIQAWAFHDVAPKPPPYDLLRPFPIWPVWMLLLLPLALLTLPLKLLGLDAMGGPYWLFLAANLAYCYLLSCLIVAAWGWIAARWRSRRTGAL